jgi:hypothetical protein
VFLCFFAFFVCTAFVVQQAACAARTCDRSEYRSEFSQEFDYGVDAPAASANSSTQMTILWQLSADDLSRICTLQSWLHMCHCPLTPGHRPAATSAHCRHPASSGEPAPHFSEVVLHPTHGGKARQAWAYRKHSMASAQPNTWSVALLAKSTNVRMAPANAIVPNCGPSAYLMLRIVVPCGCGSHGSSC